MKIKAYEYQINCEKCGSNYLIHFPTSFTDYLVMRCNDCFEERLIASYGKAGLSGFSKYIGLDNQKHNNVVFELRAGVQACSKKCKCGGTFLFVSRSTPIVCSKCENIILPKDLKHATTPEESQLMKKEIEINLIEWRGNIGEVLAGG